MGRVSLLDNFFANYHTKAKDKKWWWRLFVNFLDVAIVNTWKLHRISNESTINSQDFQSVMSMSMLQTF